MPVVNNANDVSSVSARVFAILKDFDVWHMPLFSLLSQIINQSLLKKLATYQPCSVSHPFIFSSLFCVWNSQDFFGVEERFKIEGETK
jgi:hypothetical protein